MKKEDLLLVFDFLATALKQDVVEEKQVEPVKEIYEDYDYVDNVLIKKDEPDVECEETELVEESKPHSYEDFKGVIDGTKILDGDNNTVKTIKKESVRIKEIMDVIDAGKVFPYKKAKTPETDIEKILREHEKNIASQIILLESKVRDSLATPEQRNHFKEFIKMENFRANKDLDRIWYFLDNPGLENPYQGVGEIKNLDKDVDEPEKTKVVGDLNIPISEEILAKSNVPQMIKDIMIKPKVPTSVSLTVENGEVKLKEEFKNGLGPDKKYGYDGKEIKE